MNVREFLTALALGCFAGLLLGVFGMNPLEATLIGFLFFLGSLSLFNYLRHGKLMPFVCQTKKILVLEMPGASRPYEALILKETDHFYLARWNYGDSKFSGRTFQILKNDPAIARVFTR